MSKCRQDQTSDQGSTPAVDGTVLFQLCCAHLVPVAQNKLEVLVEAQWDGKERPENCLAHPFHAAISFQSVLSLSECLRSEPTYQDFGQQRNSKVIPRIKAYFVLLLVYIREGMFGVQGSA